MIKHIPKTKTKTAKPDPKMVKFCKSVLQDVWDDFASLGLIEVMQERSCEMDGYDFGIVVTLKRAKPRH